MTEQLELFCTNEAIKKSFCEKENRISKILAAAPDNVTLLYTCTMHGRNSGGKYFMSIEDAKKFCSDDRTKGFAHKSAWSFFWTSLKNYFGNGWDLAKDGANFSNFFDDGRFDFLLDELGIKKIDPNFVFKHFEAKGIKVIRPKKNTHKLILLDEK